MRVLLLSIGVMVLSLVLSGCDGGSGSNNSRAPETPVNPPVEPPPEPLPPEGALTGFLVDSAVSGVSWETPTLKGVTDADGRFNYRAGEAVYFRIGDTLLGRIMGQPQVTPFDLAGSEVVTGLDILDALAADYDSSFHAVINIVVLLQSLDTDGDPDNGIEILPEVAALLSGVSLEVVQDWTSFQREPALLQALSQANSASLFQTPHGLAQPAAALEHLYATVGVDPLPIRLIAETGEEQGLLGEGDPVVSRGPTEHWSYNAAGTLEFFEWREEGGELRSRADYRFDESGRLVEETVYRGTAITPDYSVAYAYNVYGDQTLRALDGGSDGVPESDTRIWEYQYDDLGRLIMQSELDSNRVWKTEEHYDYDDKGNRIYYQWMCNEEAHETGCLSYDFLGDGEASPIEDWVATYEYDSRGNTIRVTVDHGPDGTIDVEETYQYDAMGNLTWDGDEGVEYEYDANGNVVRVSGDEGSATTEYDNFGRVVAAEDGDSTFKYEYDTKGNKVRFEEDVGKNGTVDHLRLWIYDTDNRLVRIEEDNPGDTSDYIETFEYEGENLVRHARHVEGVEIQITLGEKIWRYQYDPVGYLVWAQEEDYLIGSEACLTCTHLIDRQTRDYEPGTWQNVLTPLPDPPPPVD